MSQFSNFFGYFLNHEPIWLLLYRIYYNTRTTNNALTFQIIKNSVRLFCILNDPIAFLNGKV